MTDQQIKQSDLIGEAFKCGDEIIIATPRGHVTKPSWKILHRFPVPHPSGAAPQPPDELTEPVEHLAFCVIAALERRGYWKGMSEDHHDSERIVFEELNRALA